MVYCVETPSEAQAQAVQDVLNERARQDRQWGVDNDLSFLVGMGALAEEAGEFVKACMDYRHAVTKGGAEYTRTRQDMVTELVQVTAMGLKLLERLHAQQWASPASVAESR